MNRSLVLGIIVGALLVLPVGASAWTNDQKAKPIYGADCPKEAEYYGNCSVNVYVFDDAGNKCYIAKGSNAAGISCVKQ